MKKILILLYLFIGVNLHSFGQEVNDFNPQPILPPSPTASSLGQYGLIPVGKFTGTAQFNIPIFNLNSKKLSIPISLNYSTNGVKVDQIASWVGMGWSLNAGGVITRTVKHDRDGKNTLVSLEEAENYSGFERYELIEGLLFYGDRYTKDTQPDIFSFNFNGVSGKFIIGGDGVVRMIPHQDIEIEAINNSAASEYTFVITTKDGIKYYFGEEQNSHFPSTETTLVRSECDEIGIFDISTTAWNLTRIVHPTGDQINLKYKEGIELVSNYSAGINQRYRNHIINPFSLNVSEPEGKKTCVTQLRVSNSLIDEITTENIKVKFEISDRIDFEGKKLDAIVISKINGNQNDLRFNFNYIYSNNLSNSNSWSESNSKRLFLKELVEYDSNLNNFKKHSFEYNDIDNLPVRLSFSQDHWGYYNGANNGSVFYTVPSTYENMFPYDGADREPNGTFSQYGTLKKINYPTGGYSEIEYEPHNYPGKEIIYENGDLDSYNLSLTRTPFGTNKIIDVVSIPEQEELKFTAKLSCLDPDGNPCDTEEGEAKVKITGNNRTLFSVTLTNNYNQDNLPLTVLSQAISNFSGGDLSVELEISEPNVTGSHYKIETYFSYYKNPPSEYTIDKNIETGGVRVKRITSKSNLNTEPIIKRYYYSPWIDFDKSSGRILHNPNYISSTKSVYYSQSTSEFIPCEAFNPCVRNEIEYFTASSNSVNTIYNTGGYHISYSSVYESNGENFENGGIFYEYKVKGDDPGRMLFSGGATVKTVNSNTGWDSGLLLNKKVFRKNENGTLIKLKTETYNYRKDNRISDVFTAAALVPYFVIKAPDVNGYNDIICDQSNIILTYGYWKCIADHKHFYHWDPVNKTIKCMQLVGSPANNVKVNIPLPCNDKQPGQGINYDNTLDNFTLILYDIITEWQYLENRITTQFDKNGENPVTDVVEYEYSNPLHLQLTKTVSTESNGEITTQEFYYPFDYNYSNIQEFEPLLLEGQYGLLIDNRKKVNDTLVSGQLAKYNDKGQVIEIYQAENELGTTSNFDPLNPYSYGDRKVSINYDTNTGNINEFNKEGGVISVYMWGYKEQYPVAKVENGTYLQVESTLTANELTNIKEGTYDDVTMRNVLNNIRTSLTDSQVTTYTYDPLIGVTSITDPSGYTSFYVYDDFNRLLYIKDKDGIVLKSYKYHYQGQEEEVAATTYTVTNVIDGGVGSVSITPIDVESGSYSDITATPGSGYEIDYIKVGTTSYPFTNNTARIDNITSNTEVHVQFKTLTTALSVNPTFLFFEDIDGNKTITVTSGGSWTVSKSDSWIIISTTTGSGNGTFTVRPLKNLGSQRTGTVTVSDGSTSKTISIEQLGGGGPL